MMRRIPEVAAALLVAAMGAVSWAAGAAVPPSFLDTAFGSGFLPILVGAALVGLALLWLVELVRDRQTAPEGGQAPAASEAIRPIVLGALLVAFVLNMQAGVVPFYPAAALFILAGCLAVGGVSARTALLGAAVAAGGTGLAYLLFTHVFLVIFR